MLRLVATMTGWLLCAACGSPPKQAAPPVVIWQRVGSWSGHGGAQTESFTGGEGSFRVRWETSGGTGAFRLTFYSGISGRPLAQVVDHRGAGSGTSYFAEDPRPFYLVVESADVNWSFTVEEAFAGMAEMSGK